MKKILAISPVDIFPPSWGSGSRIYNLTKGLANNNKVWYLGTGVHIHENHSCNCDEFLEFSSNPNISLNYARTGYLFPSLINPWLILKGLKIIKKEKIDLIFANHLTSSISAMILRFLTGVPYILDQHTCEAIRYARTSKKKKVVAALLKTLENLACKFAYKIFAVSDLDREFFISVQGVEEGKIITIPNAVDTEKFYPNKKNIPIIKKTLKISDEPLILFFGTMKYEPNFEAIKIILHEILPRVLKKLPCTKFLVTGDTVPHKFNHENIIFAGRVDKIEDYINAADVVIAPLLSGAGTKTKILESLTCGKIVITTTIGAEGIDSEGIEDYLRICDDWDKFAEEIVVSISKKIITNQKMFSMYSWKKSINKVENLLEKI